MWRQQMPFGPMAQSIKSDKKLRDREQRRARLAAELRTNLHKRKAQARSRRDAAEGAAEGEVPAAGPDGRTEDVA